MKQKSDWKRITLLRKASFKKEIKILAANKRQTGSWPETGFWETKVGLLQSLWTFSSPQPNPQYAMSCTTSA
jgi:hypothetical protein